MKHTLHCLLLVLLSAGAAFGSDYAADLIADNAAFYREHTDKVIREWADKGTHPDAETVLRIQTLENRFLSMLRLDPSLLGSVPPMHLAGSDFKDLRHLPGQFVLLRAREAGLDLMEDRLGGRSFKQTAVGGTETLEWEFENLLNACVHWMADGNRDKAVEALVRANRLKVQAAPSDRARYLSALLLDGSTGSLDPALRATLPRK